MIFAKTLITMLIISLLSFAFTKISTKIEYSYGSKKKEIVSIVLAALYAGVLSYFTRISNPKFTLIGEIYFYLFLVISTISISSSFIDLEYQEIPNSYNLITAFLGMSSVALMPNLVNAAILSGGIMFGIYFIIMLITNAMGGGDVKMAGALGLIIPISHLKLFIISPFAIGSVIALYLIFIKKQDKDKKIPFGPYITLGYLFTIFIYWVI